MSSDEQDATVYHFTPPPPPPPASRRPSRRSRITKTAAGLALVLGAGTGVAVVTLGTSSGPNSALAAANAASPGPVAAPKDAPDSNSSPSSPTTTSPVRHRRYFGTAPGAFGAGPFGAFLAGPGAGANGVIHGSYTIKGPSGTYETVDTQYGTAGDITSTSITVTSADGFSQTYVVSSSTIVDADSQGITAVKDGDEVSIVGLVSGSTVTAQRVVDLTQVQANRKAWAPGPPSANTPGFVNGPFGRPGGRSIGGGWDGNNPGPGPSAA